MCSEFLGAIALLGGLWGTGCATDFCARHSDCPPSETCSRSGVCEVEVGDAALAEAADGALADADPAAADAAGGDAAEPDGAPRADAGVDAGEFVSSADAALAELLDAGAAIP